MRKTSAWRKYLTERLSANCEETVHFLDAIMEEFQIYENVTTLQGALEVVIEAQGGVSELAKRTHMSPDALQKILSSEKAPDVETFGTILKGLGYRLSILPLETANSCSETASENN